MMEKALPQKLDHVGRKRMVQLSELSSEELAERCAIAEMILRRFLATCNMGEEPDVEAIIEARVVLT